MLNKPRCQLCRHNHPLKYCTHFQIMAPAQRRAHVKQHGYCLNCFAQSHNRFWCESENRCKLCGARHHTMLHEEGREQAASSFEEEPMGNKPPNLPDIKEQGLIPPLIKVNLLYNEVPRAATFLLQASTNCSFLMKTKAMEFPDISKAATKEVFEVTPAFDSMHVVATWELDIKDRATFKLPPPILSESLLKHYHYLKPKAHPNFFDCRKVDGVIGLPLMRKFMLRQYERPDPTLPRAQNSAFGWVIHERWTGCSCH